MTGDALPARSATIRSRVPHADAVAAAIAADDTDDIHTRVEDGAVVADIERPTTASLEATIDDYVVALDVATAVSSIDALPDAGGRSDDAPASIDSDATSSSADGSATRDGHSTDAQDDRPDDTDESDGRDDDRVGADATDTHDTQ